MTEKRFAIIDGVKRGTHSGIWDKQKQHNQGVGDELWVGEVVDLLNEQHEENQQLKKQLDDNTEFLIRSAERLGFPSLDHLLYTLDKGEIYGYSTMSSGGAKE